MHTAMRQLARDRQSNHASANDEYIGAEICF
jgi:hypothetical protein